MAFPASFTKNAALYPCGKLSRFHTFSTCKASYMPYVFQQTANSKSDYANNRNAVVGVSIVILSRTHILKKHFIPFADIKIKSLPLQ